MVFAMPMARIAVMGPAGKDFVYKAELAALDATFRGSLEAGTSEEEAERERNEGLAALSTRYEEELMNPKEALALGSVSKLVMPGESRRVLAKSIQYLMSKYTPTAMSGVQREHE
jgi:acetyl-CoA carboxylase carboxyltransferase component